MKTKDFAALGRRLLPELPGFTVKGQMIFIQPVAHTLRGICFDGSSFDPNLFFVQVFAQPLFVPAKRLALNIGWRLGGGSHRWNVNAPGLLEDLSAVLKREALPFLARIESPRDLAQAATSLQKSQDPYTQQAVAYALARAGDVNKAVAELDQLTRLLDVKVPWQLEMLARANALKSQLLRDAPSAQKQLQAWEAESVRNLGLEKFR